MEYYMVKKISSPFRSCVPGQGGAPCIYISLIIRAYKFVLCVITFFLCVIMFFLHKNCSHQQRIDLRAHSLIPGILLDDHGRWSTMYSLHQGMSFAVIRWYQQDVRMTENRQSVIYRMIRVSLRIVKIRAEFPHDRYCSPENGKNGHSQLDSTIERTSVTEALTVGKRRCRGEG